MTNELDVIDVRNAYAKQIERIITYYEQKIKNNDMTAEHHEEFKRIRRLQDDVAWFKKEF